MTRSPRCCQLREHWQDAVGDLLEIGVDLGQRERRFEHVEVPVEGNLVADFGFVVVDPGSVAWGSTSRLKYDLTSSVSGTFSVSRRDLSVESRCMTNRSEPSETLGDRPWLDWRPSCEHQKRPFPPLTT